MTADEFIAWMHRQDKPVTKALEKRYYGDPARHVRFDREKGKGMQRDIDEVEVLLDIWAEWMRKPDLPVQGYRIATGFDTSSGDDQDALYEAHDLDRIQRIDAAFDSLAPIYKEAIMKKYRLGSRVFNFARDCTFDDAKTVIRVKFVLKGLL